MAKCSTIFHVKDSLNHPGEKIVEVGKLLEDIDTSMDDFFKDIEINVSSELVSRTLALAEKKNKG